MRSEGKQATRGKAGTLTVETGFDERYCRVTHNDVKQPPLGDCGLYLALICRLAGDDSSSLEADVHVTADLQGKAKSPAPCS